MKRAFYLAGAFLGVLTSSHIATSVLLPLPALLVQAAVVLFAWAAFVRLGRHALLCEAEVRTFMQNRCVGCYQHGEAWRAEDGAWYHTIVAEAPSVYATGVRGDVRCSNTPVREARYMSGIKQLTNLSERANMSDEYGDASH